MANQNKQDKILFVGEMNLRRIPGNMEIVGAEDSSWIQLDVSVLDDKGTQVYSGMLHSIGSISNLLKLLSTIRTMMAEIDLPEFPSDHDDIDPYWWSDGLEWMMNFQIWWEEQHILKYIWTWQNVLNKDNTYILCCYNMTIFLYFWMTYIMMYEILKMASSKYKLWICTLYKDK